MLSENELDICTRMIAELGSDQPEDILPSLVWVLRNRIEKTIDSLEDRSNIANACDNILREAADHKSRNTNISLSSAEWYRIRAMTYLVWAGDIADRTGGAVACHRHDTNPAWARSRTPTALLGGFLFFR